MERAGAPIPEAEFSSADWGDSLVARLNSTGSHGILSLRARRRKRPRLISRLEAAGAEPADAEAARVVRLEHGKPRYGEDISERFLAQEANQPHALHFSKGCYLGQEIVERVRSRGQIHRVLKPLVLDTKEPPAPGTKLQIDGADAEITSAAYSPALDKVVALAYVRTESLVPGVQHLWNRYIADDGVLLHVVHHHLIRLLGLRRHELQRFIDGPDLSSPWSCRRR